MSLIDNGDAGPISASDATALLNKDARPRDTAGRFLSTMQSAPTEPPAPPEPPSNEPPVDPQANNMRDAFGDISLDDNLAAPDEPPAPGPVEDEPLVPDTEPQAPAVDAPRSWTAAEKAAFASLPPEVQHSIVERERKRDTDIRTGQNEAAKLRQEADQVKKTAEETRSRYEQMLPQLEEHLRRVQMGDFADIKSWDDVQRLAAEEPIRFMKWQALQQQQAAVANQQAQAKQRQEAEAAELLRKYRLEENQKFLEAAPEFADPQKLPTLQRQVKSLLNDVGVEDDELQTLWAGDGKISIHDHRTQLIIRDAMLYRQAKAKAAQPPARKPPNAAPQVVQRPGVAQTRGEVRSARVDDLEQRLTKSHSREDAIALLRARRQK